MSEKTAVNPAAIGALNANIAPLVEHIAYHTGTGSFSIAYGNYNIGICIAYVAGKGTSISAIQTSGNGNASVTHIAGDSAASNNITVSNSGGTLTVGTGSAEHRIILIRS